jgi:threonine synthase
MTIEGKKTGSVEIVEQLGRVPDAVFVPCGDGVILAGVYRGFEDMVTLGRIERVPRIYAVQAEGSIALKRAFDEGFDTESRDSHTIADSIQVDVPRNGRMAVDKLRRYGGGFAVVTDDEILKAQRALASYSGVFAEPAAAASFAGFLKVSNTLDTEALVVLMVTGNGLKDIDSAAAALDQEDRVDRSL